VDEQLKIRGYRIEPGEIEQALRGHSAVQDAVVIARADENGAERLVAYLIGGEETTPQIGELRQFLKERLPSYMIPAAFLYLEELPLNASGKVDRRALPAPDWQRSLSEQEYIAPRTATEEVLCRIWAEVLTVERVGIYDSFFDLGGHSLLATQVIARVNETLRVELLVRHLFESPTVAEMADRVVVAKQSQDGRAEKVAEAFQLVESLTDDEARALLEQKQLT
jgi:hypothetical protein